MRKILLIALLILGKKTIAQDYHFSQMYAVSSYYNPCYAGFTGIYSDKYVLYGSFRNQWIQSNSFIKNTIFSAEAAKDIKLKKNYYLNFIRAGIGANILNDLSGDLGYSNLQVNIPLTVGFNFNTSKSLLSSNSAVNYFALGANLCAINQYEVNSPENAIWTDDLPESINSISIDKPHYSSVGVMYDVNDFSQKNGKELNIGIAVKNMNTYYNFNNSHTKTYPEITSTLKFTTYNGKSFTGGGITIQRQNKYNESLLELYHSFYVIKQKKKVLGKISLQGRINNFSLGSPGSINKMRLDAINICWNIQLYNNLFLGYTFELTNLNFRFHPLLGLANEINLKFFFGSKGHFSIPGEKSWTPKGVSCPRM